MSYFRWDPWTEFEFGMSKQFVSALISSEHFDEISCMRVHSSLQFSLNF